MESFGFKSEMFFRICVYILKCIAEWAQMRVKLVFEALTMLMLAFGCFNRKKRYIDQHTLTCLYTVLWFLLN